MSTLERAHKKPRLWVPDESPRKATPILSRRAAVDALMAEGLPYSKKLTGHTSCVNALSISNDGRWLASAGDDLDVQLWDFDQDHMSAPSWKFTGPRSNVFTLAFSASGQYLYSGDVNADIFQYDLSHLVSPVASKTSRPSASPSAHDAQHNGSIRAISCHPEQDHLFLSAAEDGRVILHDMRADSRNTHAQGILQQIAPFSHVQYHPTMTQLFATSDTQGVVCLRDVRMAFGPSSRRRRECVVKYVTAIAKQGQPCMARPETSSLTFDREGRKMALTMLHHYPTLYTLEDPHPIATFSGRFKPDGSHILPGERTWSNSCTMKHGSFGGFGSDRDDYYAHGSDDFRTYLWKIPDEAALREQRIVIDHLDWETTARPGEIGYAESYFTPRYVPVELSVPHARLTGHESIVNTALIHPSRPYLLTAGIERIIRLHSPTAASPSTEPLARTPQGVRAVPASDPNARLLLLHEMGIIDEPVEDAYGEGDARAIALFDQILRTEGDGDVFEIRAFGPDSDEEMVDEDSD